MSMCFVRVPDESFLDILIAPLLSTKMRTGFLSLSESVNSNILLSHMASLTADERAMYSVSEDWATHPFFFRFPAHCSSSHSKDKTTCRLPVDFASAPIGVTVSNRIEI